MLWNYFRILNPILFQGPRKKSPYFEGWYFKQVSGGNANARTFSAIPGISRSAEGDSAFIQTIGGTGQASRFFRFPYTDFSYSDTPFEIRIGENQFSLKGMDLDLADKNGAIRAHLRYSELVPPRASLLRPGVMGPYGFTPFLECYHGIASMHHDVAGSVTFGKERQSFDGGRGYIEKDWGKSMPSSWIWIQTTEFAPAIGHASFSFSLARVPWLGSSFAGFICLFWVGEREYRFASYTGARIELLESDETSTRILLSDRKYKLEIQLRKDVEGSSSLSGKSDPSILAAPVEGSMKRSIRETLDCNLRVILKRRHGSVDDIIVDAPSAVAAAEVAGDISELAP